MSERRLPTVEEMRAAGTIRPTVYDNYRARNERLRRTAAAGAGTAQLRAVFGVSQPTVWRHVHGKGL